MLFPRFAYEVDKDHLMTVVSKEELLAVLSSYHKDKSSSPNNWLIEFFIGLFNIIGVDLLKVVEESMATGRIHQPFNTTFITLIPKMDSLATFGDFKPTLQLHLYDHCKGYTSQTKAILSNVILGEQRAFP